MKEKGFYCKNCRMWIYTTRKIKNCPSCNSIIKVGKSHRIKKQGFQRIYGGKQGKSPNPNLIN